MFLIELYECRTCEVSAYLRSYLQMYECRTCEISAYLRSYLQMYECRTCEISAHLRSYLLMYECRTCEVSAYLRSYLLMYECRTCEISAHLRSYLQMCPALQIYNFRIVPSCRSHIIYAHFLLQYKWAQRFVVETSTLSFPFTGELEYNYNCLLALLNEQ